MKALLILFSTLLSAICTISCKPNRDISNSLLNGGGYVIGKERCHIDTTQDYWLIDFSIAPLPNDYGDSLILNGITYRHVVKTIDLAPQFKLIGAKVDFDFHLSPSFIQSSNCDIATPITYSLKEMQVQRQSEIR